VGQSLSQHCRRFGSKPTILDVAQTAAAQWQRLPLAAGNQHEIANSAERPRFKNTTAQFELLAFDQVQPS
jgi:hypothetical protein